MPCPLFATPGSDLSCNPLCFLLVADGKGDTGSFQRELFHDSKPNTCAEEGREWHGDGHKVKHTTCTNMQLYLVYHTAAIDCISSLWLTSWTCMIRQQAASLPERRIIEHDTT